MLRALWGQWEGLNWSNRVREQKDKMLWLAEPQLCSSLGHHSYCDLPNWNSLAHKWYNVNHALCHCAMLLVVWAWMVLIYIFREKKRLRKNKNYIFRKSEWQNSGVSYRSQDWSRVVKVEITNVERVAHIGWKCSLDLGEYNKREQNSRQSIL